MLVLFACFNVGEKGVDAKERKGTLPERKNEKLRRKRNIRNKRASTNPAGCAELTACRRSDTHRRAGARSFVAGTRRERRRQPRKRQPRPHRFESGTLLSETSRPTSQLTRVSRKRRARYLDRSGSGEPCIATSTARRPKRLQQRTGGNETNIQMAAGHRRSGTG